MICEHGRAWLTAFLHGFRPVSALVHRMVSPECLHPAASLVTCPHAPLCCIKVTNAYWSGESIRPLPLLPLAAHARIL